MARFSSTCVLFLGLSLFGHTGLSQIIGVIPDADTVFIGGGCTPPLLRWTQQDTAASIDTIAVLPGFNTWIWTNDSLDRRVYWEQFLICIQDSSHELTYALLTLDRTAMPLPVWVLFPKDSELAFPMAYTLKAIILKNGTPVDSAFQLLVSRVGLSVPQVVQPISSCQLDQNYPNPFNPSTTISFTLEHRAYVELQIYNLLGQLIITLVAEDLPSGTYSHPWSPTGLPSGLYLCRLTSRAFQVTKKLQLLR